MVWSFIDGHNEQYFMGLDMYQLQIDEFYLKVNSNLTNNDTYLYTLHKDCIDCPYTSDVLLFNPDTEKSQSVTGKYSTNLKFRIASGYPDVYLPQDETESVICDVDKNFGQFGVYNVDVNEAGCYINTLKEPVNIYTPIITVFLLYTLLFAAVYGSVLLWKKFHCEQNSKDKEHTPKKVRIKSLDTFRGITIVLMIFANFGCGGYHFIEHTTWNGLHIADLVFPCFIWIMGACIPMSLNSNFKKGLSNKTIFLNILKRTIKLFCLGIFLGSGANLSYLRILGVLQRFGIAYLAVTGICLFFMKRSSNKDDKEASNKFEDILILSKCWFFALVILLIHTIIIFCVAAPGCPKGYMGPGGLHKNRSYTECIGGATGYVDKLILGNHAYQNPTIKQIYKSAPFDPEGILGCLTTIVHVFFGVQAGVTLAVYKSHSQRILRWLLWGVLCGLVGGGLCGFSKENGVIPVNKNLWSTSFVLVTSCCAFTLLAACYIFVDLKKWWTGKPFLFAGMNAILMYIGHEMTDGHFPVRWYIQYEGRMSRKTHFEALLSDTWGVGIWVLVSYYLYKINYFFTV
ncbi:heparan-alpha-glucosaminide N-acetyltransferase-like [Anoplophora glabripennis]|uniref:heparan-alpha-glucosaminide N-acetyltransferase-like n=1 Tax=Anoplophora glabripennis TaxID=217634 RepID=UPI000874AAC1|nr:heparan-alpha-glucosaminide N-acetyltransferase-like [Anoplophora glabripennis]XP_018578373.1 heparan-alpha-glucosaminide N-acetyltransferase-like [Anoplophora glabripennis]